MEIESAMRLIQANLLLVHQSRRPAYDVTLTDNRWDKKTFEVVNGNTSRSWERHDAGGILSHSLELEAKVKGLFYGAPALVTFCIPTKTTLQQAYSTPILPLHILADKPLTDKFDLINLIL